MTNLQQTEAMQRLQTMVSKVSRTQGLAVAGVFTALVIALVVWRNGDSGLVWSLFVGVAVVLFAITCALGSLALILALRHQDDQATQWSLKSLWFLLAGLGVVLVGVVIT